MSRARTAVPVLAVAALLLSAAGAASAATLGSVSYGIQVSYLGTTQSAVVNESVSAGTSPGFDTVAVSVSSGGSTFSYSTQVNSTLEISPFIPSISNQSLSYKYNGTTLALSILRNGSESVQFHGSTYTLTSYAVKATLGYNGTTQTISGALSTFPSGLVYSARASAQVPSLSNLGNFSMPGAGSVPDIVFPGLTSLPLEASSAETAGTVTFSITLLSTSLPLSGPSPSMTDQMASLGIGAGAVASVLALGLRVRSRRRHPEEAAPKPEYAVD